MEITKNNLADGELEVVLVGRLDTTTAPDLEAAVKDDLANATKVVLNLKGIEYVSSAGLRVILMIQKTMGAKSGTLVLKGVCDEVMEVFDMTGFSTFLTFEN